MIPEYFSRTTDRFRQGPLAVFLSSCFWITACLLIINQAACFFSYQQFKSPMNIFLLAVLFLSFSVKLFAQSPSIIRAALGPVVLSYTIMGWALFSFFFNDFTSDRPGQWLAILAGISIVWWALLFLQEKTGNRWTWLLKTFYWTALFAALLGIIQFLSPQIFDTSIFSFSGRKQIVGPFNHHNQLASFLIAALPISVCGILAHRRKYISQLPDLAVASCLLTALIFSSSRGAWLGLFLGWIVMISVYLFKEKKMFAVYCLLSLSLLAGGFTLWRAVSFLEYFNEVTEKPARQIQQALVSNIPLTEDLVQLWDLNADNSLDCRDLVIIRHRLHENVSEVSSANPRTLPSTRWEKIKLKISAMIRQSPRAAAANEDVSLENRIFSVWTCWQIWQENPVWGVGPGNFTAVAPGLLFSERQIVHADTHAHNLPMQMLAETGLPGIVAWFGFLILILYNFFRSLPESGEPAGLPLSFFLGWSLLAVLIHNVVDITLWYQPMKYIYPFLVALFVYHCHTSYSDSHGFSAARKSVAKNSERT